jgi:site-specific recombinase XerD
MVVDFLANPRIGDYDLSRLNGIRGGGAAMPAAVTAPEPGERGHLQHALVSAIRTRHYSRRTEQAYWHWTRQFVLWSGKRHPLEMGAPEVGAFLSHLATERHVSASTQRQALAALLFLYQQALQVELPWVDGIVRAQQPQKLPSPFCRTEPSTT